MYVCVFILDYLAIGGTNLDAVFKKKFVTLIIYYKLV